MGGGGGGGGGGRRASKYRAVIKVEDIKSKVAHGPLHSKSHPALQL